MHIEYTTSQRGKKQLIYHNFLYTLHSEKQEYSRWRCQNRRCPGVICLAKDDDVVISETGHTHPAPQRIIASKFFMKKIKDDACNTAESSSSIVVKYLKNVDNSEAKLLPKLKTIKNTINIVRNKKIGFVKEGDVDVPITLRNDYHGNLFLRFDSNLEDENRFIVLASHFKEQFFPNAKIFLIDGTFKIAPHGFAQIVSIHSYLLGKYYPFVTLLMKNKKELTYRLAFAKVMEIFKLKCEVLITDFEQGLFNAAKEVFKPLKGYTCLFHFGQSIWRWIQNHNFTLQFKNNYLFKKSIHFFEFSICERRQNHKFFI